MRALLLATLVVTGSAVTVGCRSPSAPSPDVPTLAMLRAAPSSVQVGPAVIILNATLWRDFEPPLPPGGRPLTLVVSIATSDTAIAPPVELEAAWVLQGRELWRPVLEYDPLDAYPNTILKFGRNGPKWEPGSRADVIVRVRDTSGRAYLIRAANEEVMAAR